jgi:hypothetical protein
MSDSVKNLCFQEIAASDVIFGATGARDELNVRPRLSTSTRAPGYTAIAKRLAKVPPEVVQTCEAASELAVQSLLRHQFGA